MKSYEETIHTVLDRVHAYETAKRRKRKTTARVIAMCCCVSLATLLGVGVWHGTMRYSPPPASAENSSSGGSLDSSSRVVSTVSPDVSVIWNTATDDDVHNAGLAQWEGKTVAFSLYDALGKETDGPHVFAIAARPSIDDQFVYNGKTLAEYFAQAEKERHFPDKLWGLLKVGESLKYGEALYQTGTPEGEKWAKELYDKTVAEYGEELLSQYIVDGVFLREKVEADIAAYHEDSAQKAYDAACAAYMEPTLESAQKQLNGQNIPWERRPGTDFLILYASADEFASLSFNSLSKWFFSLASKALDGADDLTAVQNFSAKSVK